VSERSTVDTINPFADYKFEGEDIPKERNFDFDGVNSRGSWGIDYAGDAGHKSIHTRIAIYLRVSTREQNVDNQLPIIETYLRANFPNFDNGNIWSDGHQHFDLYWDHETGKTTDRKAWGVLFNRMQSKKYDHIITWHVDRVSRDIEQFAGILRIARASGCTLHFASLHIRSDSPMMEFMAKFFCLWAEHEVALKEMRQREGIERRRNSGAHMGRLPDMSKDEELFELLRKEPNISINKIAKHFGKSRSWAKLAKERVS